MRKNDSFTYFNLLIFCMWQKVINRSRSHQGQSRISTFLQILCSPYSLQAGGLHSTEMLLFSNACDSLHICWNIVNNSKKIQI